MASSSITRPVSLAVSQARMSAEETLVRIRQLDPRSLALVHDQFYPVVYRYIRYRLDDENICEDLASEVFLCLLTALHQKKGPNLNLQGWLLGTASHLVIDHLRRKYTRKYDSLDDYEDISGTHNTENTIELSWQKSQVRHALTRLTPDQQHVLALRFSDDRSIEETARILGKSIGAVKTLQFRALASLKRYMQERENS